MKMLSTIGILLALGTFSAWGQNEEALSHLSFETVIQSDAKSLSVAVQNNYDSDIYCSQLVFRSEVENPEKYVVIGEKLYVKENLYLRSKKEINDSKTFSFSSSEIENFLKDLPTASLKNARLDSQMSHCEVANFYDYAWFSEKTALEEKTLDLIYRELKLQRPYDVQKEILDIRKLDFSRSEIQSLKPLQFFPYLRKLDISRTKVELIDALRFLSQLEVLNISESNVKTLRPVFIFRDRLKVVAKSHRLRDPKELLYFKK